MKVCPTCGNQWPDDQKFCPNDGSALRSAGGTDLVGSVIGGNYHIKKKLGEGGMGAVYLGEHVKMSRKSAIKVMTQSMAHDPDAIARFNREATNAARINHPNVCAIYDFGESDGLIFLAMEFIEGSSLTSLIEAGAIPLQRAARILSQIGDALQAAHDLGIVHRDLKPDNIMITRGRDGADMVKVVDFGIAKAMGGEEGQKVTKTGLVVGTPEYMSPEQLSGDRLDGRSDIYSLALVFFRMITGTLPFQADSAQETMIKRLTDDPMKLNEAMPGANFPPRLQQIMDRALARMPADRYASAHQFARDVVKAIEGVGASVAPTTDDGATQLISAQDAKTAALAATRVSSSPPPRGRTAIATPPTPQPRPSVSTPVQKKKPVALISALAVVVIVGGGAAVMWRGGGSTANGKQAEGVIPDTAQKAGQADNSAANKLPAGNPSQPGVQKPAGNQTRTDTARHVASNKNGTITNPPAPAVDSIALDRELDQLNDSLGGDARQVDAARKRATSIYSSDKNPTTLRTIAALVVSIANQSDGNTAEACRWVDLGLKLKPDYTPAAKHRQRLGCQ